MAVVAVGIDIAKRNFEVALYEEKKSKSYPNTPEGIQQLLKRLEGQDVHGALEATGNYGFALARALHQAGHRVSILNPLSIHRYAASKLKRTKTDGVDAKLIAEYVAKEQPRAWVPPREELVQLKELTRRLENFKEVRQMEKNRLGSGGICKKVQELTKKLIAELDSLIKETQREIQTHMSRDIELKRQRDLLVSIPGIGVHTASVLLAEMGELSQFSSAKQLAAYAGVCPGERSSGDLKTKTLMSKVGNGHLRKAVYMPAIVAKRRNPAVKELCDRLTKANKHKMVVVGAAMRKLLHIAFGVLKSGRPFDAQAHHTHARVGRASSLMRPDQLAIAA